MTTDEIDHITPEERTDVVGYCEHCDEFKNFTFTGNDRCKTCNGMYSSVIGLQVTTRRTFDMVRAKKDLAKWKKKAGRK